MLKIFILSVLISLSVARDSWNPRPDARCPPGTSNPPVMVSDPYDCTRFFKCEGGIAHPIPCPNGQHWSVTHNRCEWPEYEQLRIWLRSEINEKPFCSELHNAVDLMNLEFVHQQMIHQHFYPIHIIAQDFIFAIGVFLFLETAHQDNIGVKVEIVVNGLSKHFKFFTIHDLMRYFSQSSKLSRKNNYNIKTHNNDNEKNNHNNKNNYSSFSIRHKYISVMWFIWFVWRLWWLWLSAKQNKNFAEKTKETFFCQFVGWLVVIITSKDNMIFEIRLK